MKRPSRLGANCANSGMRPWTWIAERQLFQLTCSESQLFGAVVVGVWAAGMGFIIFKVLDKVHGLRVPARVEEEGLDIYEHGESAYN